MKIRNDCSTCRFFRSRPIKGDLFYGWCHRHAPRPFLETAELRERVHGGEEVVDVYTLEWPITLADDWCGEWDGEEA